MQELRWNFLIRSGRRLTSGTVAKHVLTWRSWESWLRSCHGVHFDDLIFNPDPIVFAQFLEHETERGSTLGASRLTSCRWLRTKLGVPFPTEDPVVLDFAVAPAEHVVTQAEVIDPTTFVNILALINKVTVGMAQEYLLVLFWAVSCVRRLHLCTSTITGHDANFIYGRCAQAKCRRKGVRQPFDWAVPSSRAS